MLNTAHFIPLQYHYLSTQLLSSLKHLPYLDTFHSNEEVEIPIHEWLQIQAQFPDRIFKLKKSWGNAPICW